jgi:predicted deacylase
MTAWSRGVPAITTETGQLGSNDEHYVDLATAGIRNVLRHLEMVPGAPEPNDGIVWLEHYEVIAAPSSGVFRAVVKDGWYVAEGGRLGVLTDFFGDEIAVIRSPFAGVVNYVIGTPPISAGEPVAMVSRLAEAPSTDAPAQ